MTILFWIFIFLISLAVLVKSADFFTQYSEKLGKILGIPQFIIGVSIVALGTSLPELATSVIATIQGNSDVTAANVTGSNIANILMVTGTTALIARKVTVEKNLIKLDLPILVAITALLFMNLSDGQFTLIEGMIMLLAYLVYISYNFSEHRQNMVAKLSEKIEDSVSSPEKNQGKIMLFILLSAVGVFLGANFTIDAVINISEILNIAPALIAASAIALGTSAPELMVNISAAKKKNFEMVIGNVVGSNIFNSTIVMAIPAFITKLDVDMATTIKVSLPFLVIATLLFTLSGIERKVYSFEGALYLILYVVFIGQLFNFL